MAPDSEGRVALRRALLSVSDQSGLLELAKALAGHSVELVATSGTRAALSDPDLRVRSAEELTGVGAWFGGRIKTLHPGLLGGILAPRTEEGTAELQRRSLVPIDLVVVNFYPFEAGLREKPNRPDPEELVDVGGVTLARAAAKNHKWVAVLTDPSDYAAVSAELDQTRGSLSAATRLRLARLAFERTARYDRAISAGLAPSSIAGPTPFPETATFRKDPLRLRYGENPHQATAAYGLALPEGVLSPWPLELRKGDSLSYTNLLDLDTALATVSEFPTPTAAVVKHATPCGVASGATVREALERAIATDPVARYGCVIAVNRPVEADAPEALKGVYVDLLGAPAFDPAAEAALSRRSKLKLVRVDPPAIDRPRWEAHSATGRLLLQETDRRQLVPSEFRLVTAGAPATPHEACALDFAWRVVRHAKSNAIVLADGSKTVGIGAGQATRVKAVELAVGVAGPRAKGSVLASDAFFPFADGVEVAAAAGVRAIIQPGGSLRDPEVIAVAERHGIAMYSTGWRVFRH
ncbi:MAG: bifunctional phosphoribosylaminoimidazolecarboxamide formyltransferase/IMP cyclohydrolase [Thermoplasmata archaeon]|nr:bifunctional phosphoribosylaminoimidazolecarboxamide formyltransferase/IMP cyclohydrolase [Thermoplasmata archaeon]MCI4361668.1 bifunctional phosphoribosylaminoimidazolecarboxamide formyltransferase/IMP cyclohydrolase [Thermoplasmata archaeon]